MRPLYEDSTSLGNEEAVLARLKQRWHCVGFKLPIAYRLDYALVEDGRVQAWAEIKCRGKRYEEMYLSLHKWMAGKELADKTGLPFLLVYAFGVNIYWKRVDEDTPRLVIGGRTDRKDWQDTEPMAVFALKDFNPL